MLLRAALPCLFVLMATSARGSQEDAAHRADRRTTQALNRRAGEAVERRRARNAAGEEAYDAARDRYEREMAAWRRRVAACRDGERSACR